MAKDFESLKQQALVIKNEVEDGANSSERIGGILEDMLDYDEEKRKELEEKIGSQTVEVDTELNEESQKPIANAPVAKGLNEVKQQLSTQIPDIEEAKENAIAEIGNKESDAIQNFSEQRVTPGMLSPETIQIINASGGGTINNLPDGETLAEIEMAEGLKAIGIPNRQPDTNLGYVILKKNKSLIEQITEANTIYEVRYAYDLGGETLTMPENCVLKFEGGIISNGIIIGKNTGIEASCVQIFENIKFKEDSTSEISEKSIFNIDEVPVEWFGAKSKNFDCENPTWTSKIDDLIDSSDAINQAFNLSIRCGAKATLTGKMYKINHTVKIPSHGTLYISNRSAIVAEMQGTGIMEGESEPRLALKSNEYIPTSSMAVAIELDGYSGRIEGHGQLLLNFSSYTIGVLVKGKYFNDVDVTINAYTDLRIIGGIKGNTAPDVTDTFGEGAPTTDTEGTYYFDKTNKKMYRKQGDAWSYWKNADAKYNTSFRADLTQTGSDYRLLGTNFSIWDIYGFRGIEVIQSGSCWYNDAIWKGTIGNKCSNYISFFGTGIAQHDMTSMFYQSGGEQNDSSPICYCEAHTIYLGRSWDLGAGKTTSIRFIFTESSYSCKAQWVDSYKYVEDLGKNNHIVSSEFNPDNPDNYGSFQYANLLDMRTPKTFYAFNGLFQADSFYENINDFIDTIGWTDKKDFPKNMFDGTVTTFNTLIDTDNNLYASGWTLMPANNAYGSWSRAKHVAIQIDYDINEIKNNNAEIYVMLTSPININKKLINGTNTDTANNLNRQKIIIPIWGGWQRNQAKIVFYTKSNSGGQKLRVYNIKLLVDAYYDNKTIFDNRYGNINNIPNASPTGHIYHNTELNTTLINKGTSDEHHFDSIFSPYIIEHEETEKTISNLEPNVYHRWGEIDSLTISSLKTRNTKSIDEYMIEFKSGNSPTILNITGVKWIQEPTSVIVANKTYQVSIVNNIAIIGGA